MVDMRKFIIKQLLKILNSQWFNQSPCRYGFIGNVDAFSYENLMYEEKGRPGITVKTILAEADAFRSCPMRKAGVTVIEDGVAREADIWDLHELRNMGVERK